MRWKPRPSHHVRLQMSVACDWTNHIYKDLPNGGSRMSCGCGQNITMARWVLSYWWFDNDDNHFSLHLWMSLKYRLRQGVDSTNLCACLNGASLNIDYAIIMNLPPNYYDLPSFYDSRDTVSPDYGHHDSTILYPLYNLNYKHRTRAWTKYNKGYASLLIVHSYEEEEKIIITKINTKSQNKNIL